LPRLCGFPFRKLAGHCCNNQSFPLFEFRLPIEFLPANPSRSAAANWLLSWTSAPFSTCEDRRSTLRGVSRSRYVPPSGFGYPRDGLLPPSPGRLCFAPAALMGFTLRSVPLSKGIRASPPERTHMPFLPPVCRSREVIGRPDGLRLLGFAPFESPLRPDNAVSTLAAGCSLGFLPFQGSSTRALAEIPLQPPLTRFRALRGGNARSAPECQSALVSSHLRRRGNRQR
jgi:hypothetical protein